MKYGAAARAHLIDVGHVHGDVGRPRRSPAPARGSYRFGETPFTQEVADRMARRVADLVEADKKKHGAAAQGPEYWVRRIGLQDVEQKQVLERYAELPE